MMPWRNIAAMLLLSSALALQTGCGDRVDNQRSTDLMPNHAANSNASRGIGQLSMRSQTGGTARVGSEQLIRIAEQVPGVEKAILAMNDNQVVVGIQVDDQGKRKIAEKQVVSQLMWQYPEYDYYVTSNNDLFDRVRTASQNQMKGQYRTRSVTSDKEISSIVDEIAKQSVKP
ncbi:YhcN/YlaJ family sporulation lipoprotein [Paenibacillus sp. strain BS8-2]